MDSKLKAQTEKYLNEIRLFRYVEMDNENYLEKYILNMDISEKMLGIISIFEVIYRNKVHNILRDHLANDYLINPNPNFFNSSEIKIIKRAYKEAHKADVKIKEARTITLLTFGFWCGLIKNNKLWCKYLYKTFSKAARKANSLRNILVKINFILEIRNMISHHERIISKSGINIIGTLEDIAALTLGMIELEDKEFYMQIESYLKLKINEIKRLLK